MAYTVHEVAALSGVTIKTLYHYHKIGLLLPESIGENGYRYYGDRELERLQQILLFREMDFPLDAIMDALRSEPSRLQCLCEQQTLLVARRQRMDRILQTLEETIACTEKGVPMDKKAMFEGFSTPEQWKDALGEQNEHLKDTYGYDMLEGQEIDVNQMNALSMEAQQFMAAMTTFLRDGMPPWTDEVKEEIRRHLAFLNDHGTETNADAFAAENRYLLSDDFHRQMLEAQQTGLSYYLCNAAESNADG